MGSPLPPDESAPILTAALYIILALAGYGAAWALWKGIEVWLR